jgi:LuxR family maltose regulon positive regulatory protein
MTTDPIPRESAADPLAGRRRDRGIVPVKIRPPTLRTDTVERPRLTSALADSTARVVLVCAPAGFGKTVVALEWLADVERPLAWLSVDALDNEPDRFLRHLAASFRASGAPGFREAAEVLSESSKGSRTDLGADLVQALALAPAGAAVVLDDVHLLTAAPVWELLGRLVADGPPALRLVLLTREEPPLRLARLRVSGDLHEIRARDLRFRAEECERFFDALGPDTLSRTRIAELVEKTEGWAAGLRLASAALQMAEDVDAAAAGFGGRHELLVDYLLEEALRGRSPELQRFLMETSILPRFTVDACREVTGDEDAGRHLGEVDEANLFLVSLDSERRWYRYHHLFAELLSFRLERLAPERMPVLRERASLWFEREGQLSEALAQAAHLSDATLLVRLLDRHGYRMLARSEFATFAHWLERVSDPAAGPWPLFLVAVTWYHVQVDRRADLQRWLDLLDAAIADPPAGYPDAMLEEARLHRDVIRAFWLRVHGRMREALDAAREVLRRVPPRGGVLRGMTEFHIAAVNLALGDMHAARDDLERARETTRGGGAEYIFLASLGHLGAVLTQTEGAPVARRHFSEAITQAEARRLDGLPAFGIVLYQAADTSLMMDDREEALRLLVRADDVTRGERDTDIRANVLVRRARFEALEGRVEAAGALLDEAAVISRGQSLQPFGTSIELERARLDELHAQTLVGPDASIHPEAVAGEGEWTLVTEAEQVLRMRHALKAGRGEEALELASAVEAQARAGARGVALSLALLVQATLSTEPSRRHDMLGEAVRRAFRGRYVRPILEFGASVRPALEAALAGSHSTAMRAFLEERLLDALPKAETPALDPTSELGLTDREIDLLGHLATGRTNRELAQRLFLSENTVKTHLKHIYAKLDVSSRTAAVERARTLGLIEAPGG